MEKYRVGLANNCAINLDSHEKYTKTEVMDKIKELRANSAIRSSKKQYDQAANLLKYIFTNDEIEVKVVIKDEYQEANQKCIETLEEWYQVDKQVKQRKKSTLKVLLGVSILAGGFTLYANSSYRRISDLTLETQIHGGYGVAEDGDKINPYLDHSCFLGENEDRKTVDQRIEEYCQKYDLGEEVAEAAKEKFDAYYVDDVDKAEDIDLYDIYKESNGKSK